jgi:hypothetical protein
VTTAKEGVVDKPVLVCHCESDTLVFPGTVAVRRREEVTFLNVDLAEVSVLFPPGLVATGEGHSLDRLQLERGKPKSVMVAAKAPIGCFPYAVYSAKTRSLAVGNSNPRLIIYD